MSGSSTFSTVAEPELRHGLLGGRGQLFALRAAGPQHLDPHLVPRSTALKSHPTIRIPLATMPTSAAMSRGRSTFRRITISGRVVGWGTANHLKTDLVLAALDTAVAQRQPSAVIHHSDHGTQYASVAFGQRCKQVGVQSSMGSVGDAHDNALCESFFASLECGLLDPYAFKSQSEARLAIFRCIEGWYNPHRRHSGLDYQSPVNYERKHLAAA
jgi:transposase InsO family protein